MAYRSLAEIVHGAICKDKTVKLLEEFSLPRGLLPVDEIEEFSFNRSTGFIWWKLKSKKEHKFKRIGKTVVYSPEITAFIEKGHLHKITGVKARELFVLAVVCDVLVGKPSADTIKFTNPVGLSRSHPVSAFELEDDENGRK
ncbi:hypothetical protein CDL12_07043 [Handroanthus impetiginosus]|uniref:Uncharacterized protein n=1 Tax=Handroanthus impetiginosus TaxID=429701 RepID=A0A2G9HSK9_9LAMI|nr:hypothetical protein CDL12_07043 [Handroanthus impetiginosus]